MIQAITQFTGSKVFEIDFGRHIPLDTSSAGGDSRPPMDQVAISIPQPSTQQSPSPNLDQIIIEHTLAPLTGLTKEVAQVQNLSKTKSHKAQNRPIVNYFQIPYIKTNPLPYVQITNKFTTSFYPTTQIYVANYSVEPQLPYTTNDQVYFFPQLPTYTDGSDYTTEIDYAGLIVYQQGQSIEYINPPSHMTQVEYLLPSQAFNLEPIKASIDYKRSTQLSDVSSSPDDINYQSNQLSSSQARELFPTNYQSTQQSGSSSQVRKILPSHQTATQQLDRSPSHNPINLTHLPQIEEVLPNYQTTTQPIMLTSMVSPIDYHSSFMESETKHVDNKSNQQPPQIVSPYQLKQDDRPIYHLITTDNTSRDFTTTEPTLETITFHYAHSSFGNDQHEENNTHQHSLTDISVSNQTLTYKDHLEEEDLAALTDNESNLINISTDSNDYSPNDESQTSDFIHPAYIDDVVTHHRFDPSAQDYTDNDQGTEPQVTLHQKYHDDEPQPQELPSSKKQTTDKRYLQDIISNQKMEPTVLKFQPSADWFSNPSNNQSTKRKQDTYAKQDEEVPISRCDVQLTPHLQKAREYIQERKEGYACGGSLEALFHTNDPNFQLKDYVRNGKVQKGFKLAEEFTVTDVKEGLHEVTYFDTKTGRTEQKEIDRRSVLAQMDMNIKGKLIWKMFYYIDTDTGQERAGLYAETIAQYHQQAKKLLGDKDNYGMKVSGMIIKLNYNEPGEGKQSLETTRADYGDTISAIFKQNQAIYQPLRKAA